MTADPGFSSLGKLPGGHAILGQAQFLPGYSILVAGTNTPRLTDLPPTDRLAFLNGMEKLGEAVEIVCRRNDWRWLRWTTFTLRRPGWTRLESTTVRFESCPMREW